MRAVLTIAERGPERRVDEDQSSVTTLSISAGATGSNESAPTIFQIGSCSIGGSGLRYLRRASRTSAPFDLRCRAASRSRPASSSLSTRIWTRLICTDRVYTTFQTDV